MSSTNLQSNNAIINDLSANKGWFRDLSSSNLQVSGTIIANNIDASLNIIDTNINNNYYLTFTEGSGYQKVRIDTNRLIYNPGLDRLGINKDPSFNLDVSGTTKISNQLLVGNLTTSTFMLDVSGSVNIGNSLFQVNTTNNSIVLGSNTVKYGTFAGSTYQGTSGIAIGYQAAQGFSGVASGQGDYAIAIGYQAGQGIAGSLPSGQGINAIALGTEAGNRFQGPNTVAIGTSAGLANQGQYAVAIGYLAGYSGQASNSIVLNSTGVPLVGDTSGTYIAPIRNISNNKALYYNALTKEVTYGDISNGGGSGTNYWTLNGSTIVNNNNGNVKITKTLDMSNNNIYDVSSVLFHNTTYLTSGDFSGNSTTNIKSLIYNNDGTDNISNPVSIMRMSHFTSEVSHSIVQGPTNKTPLRFGTQHINQLGITFVDISKTRFIFPNELSGQFIELYIIQKTNVTNNNMSITVDISSVNNTYNESIDTRFYDRTTTITSTFGPHMISASEYHIGKIYSLFTYYTVSGSGSATVIRNEVIMKSYYV